MNNFNNVLYIPFVFYFLPSFVIFINERSYFTLLLLFIPVILGYFLLFNRKKFINDLICLYKYTPFKYYLFLIFWIIFVSIMAALRGYYTFSRCFFILMGLFPRTLFLYLFPAVVIPRYISLKNIIKFFIFAYFSIFIWGIIEFIGASFNISIINSLVHFLSNIRPDDASIIFEQSSKMLRIRSVFMEPSYYGLFVATSLPIIYNISRCKFKIYKNKFLNLFIKKSFIILTWISILLIQSPIYLIISVIISFIMFFKEIMLYVKKYFILILLALTLLILFISFRLIPINISSGPLLRIINIASIIKHFTLESLIVLDPSLATRVIHDIIQVEIFMKNAILGIGFGNTNEYVINAYRMSKTPMTQEIQMYISNATTNMLVGGNTMYTLLHQTGILGFALYCLYMIKTSFILKNIKKYFYGIEAVFITSLTQSILIIFLLSIVYEGVFANQYTFLLCGLACSIILLAKQRLNIKNNKERNINEKRKNIN